MAEEINSWSCKACNTTVNEQSENKVLPIILGGNPDIPNSSITFFICPNCYTVQMPEEIYNELQKRIKSNIITP